MDAGLWSRPSLNDPSREWSGCPRRSAAASVLVAATAACSAAAQNRWGGIRVDGCQSCRLDCRPQGSRSGSGWVRVACLPGGGEGKAPGGGGAGGVRPCRLEWERSMRLQSRAALAGKRSPRLRAAARPRCCGRGPRPAGGKKPAHQCPGGASRSSAEKSSDRVVVGGGAGTAARRSPGRLSGASEVERGPGREEEVGL